MLFQDLDVPSQLLVLGFKLVDALLLDAQQLADTGAPYSLLNRPECCRQSKASYFLSNQMGA